MNETFNIVIFSKDGEVIFDGEKKSYNNGFIGFWLPRDEDYIMRIDYGSKSGVFELSTYKDSFTCITSYKLS